MVRLAAPEPDASTSETHLLGFSGSDPFDEDKPLEELEDEIISLAARIHAATHRLLTLIAAFDRRQGWKAGGHRSCAHWLSFCTGIDLGAAREKVRAAGALSGLPQTSASMARGEISFSKVRALTRVATRANEGKLLDTARECTAAQLERVVRSTRRGSRRDEAALEEERYGTRCLSVFPDFEGMYVVRGRLPAEVGALLMRAVEAASDALYRQAVVSGGAEESNQEEGGQRRAAAQRRADALGLLAERALAVGFGPRESEGPVRRGPESGGPESRDPEGGDPESGDPESGDPESGDGGGESDGVRPAIEDDAPRKDAHSPTENADAPISGSKAERYQVVLYVDPETLRLHGERGRSELEDGTRVSAETSQRISCDAGLVRISETEDGRILDVGRRTRTIPPSIRRALEARDRGCRFPGCGSRFAEGHHIRHWAEGGETKLDNLVLLCRYHHRLVHEGGWRVGWSEARGPTFFNSQGEAKPEQPPPLGPWLEGNRSGPQPRTQSWSKGRPHGHQQGSIFG
jgi:hypothetical protein